MLVGVNGTLSPASAAQSRGPERPATGFRGPRRKVAAVVTAGGLGAIVLPVFLYHLPDHRLGRRIKVLSVEFSVDGGEMTPSMKVKRNVVTERYADAIESMYS